MVLFVTNTEPIMVEKKTKDILGYLSNVTGFDVKMAKLEPHREGELQEPHSTDLFLYARATASGRRTFKFVLTAIYLVCSLIFSVRIFVSKDML